jgi:hypothetical protein
MLLDRDILSSSVVRTSFLLGSSAISIAIVMLLVGIITVDDVVNIFGITDQRAINAIGNVVNNTCQMTSNIFDILTQLMKKMFEWAGVDVNMKGLMKETACGKSLGGVDK